MLYVALTVRCFSFTSVAGAMRLPCAVDVPTEDMTHFLTEAYIDRFKLEKLQFVNACDNGFLKFYNEPAIRVKGIYTYEEVICPLLY